MAPPNVITIVSDTLRPDHLGFNQRAGVKRTPPPLAAMGEGREPGAWIDTPNLDRFAARAVCFDQAYCGSFPTIPMRTDLLTGRYTFVSRGWTPLPAEEITLAHLLAEAGYVTQLIADTGHLFRANFHQAYSAWDWLRGQEGDRLVPQRTPVRYPCDPHKLRADRGTPLCEQQLRNQGALRYEREWSVARACESACDWLEAHHRTEAPFYLHLDLFDPHEAWLAPPWYTRRYDPAYEGQAVIAPDYAVCDFLSDRELQHARALYAAEVTLVDRWLGRVFDKIDDLGLFADTAVFLLSDHGFCIGEHGLTGKHGIKPYHTWPFYPVVSNILCLARVPDTPSRLEGSRHAGLVQPVDVVPTVLAATGIRPPAEAGGHGQSFAPALNEGALTSGKRRVAVTSGALPVHPDEPVHSTITDGRWALTVAGPRRAPVLWDQTAPAPLSTAGPVEAQNLLSHHPEVAARLHAAYVEVLQEAGTAAEKLALRATLHSGAPIPATAIVPPERSSGRP
jgi:arylsulfatase A-like enzyme